MRWKRRPAVDVMFDGLASDVRHRARSQGIRREMLESVEGVAILVAEPGKPVLGCNASARRCLVRADGRPYKSVARALRRFERHLPLGEVGRTVEVSARGKRWDARFKRLRSPAGALLMVARTIPDGTLSPAEAALASSTERTFARPTWSHRGADFGNPPQSVEHDGLLAGPTRLERGDEDVQLDWVRAMLSSMVR